MSIVPPEDLWPELDRRGEDEVRRRITVHAYGPRKLATVQAWLDRKERERLHAKARADGATAGDAARSAASTKTASWVIAWATVALVIATIVVVLLTR